jgi:sulfur carrier protein
MIDIWINGERKSVDDNASVQQILQDLGVPEHIAIVERNTKIIPKEQYGQVRVVAGDKLELVKLMGGG